AEVEGNAVSDTEPWAASDRELQAPLFDATHPDSCANCFPLRHSRIAPQPFVGDDGRQLVDVDDVVDLRMSGYRHHPSPGVTRPSGASRRSSRPTPRHRAEAASQPRGQAAWPDAQYELGAVSGPRGRRTSVAGDLVTRAACAKHWLAGLRTSDHLPPW